MARKGGSRRRLGANDLSAYADLYKDGWPPEKRFIESKLAERFSITLFGAANYMFLRGAVDPTDPVALLHIRRLANECLDHTGWSDGDDDQPMVWATALGLLTLYRWWQDCDRASAHIRRLPSRNSLLRDARTAAGQATSVSSEARRLIDRLKRIEPGREDADRYRDWARDALQFTFPTALTEPRVESHTRLRSLRRDVTFRLAADSPPWSDWKRDHASLSSLVVECKNKSKLSVDDLRQSACYLGKKMGRLGIVMTRTTTNDDVQDLLDWFVNNDDKHLLVVSDRDIIAWLRLRDERARTDALFQLYRSLREGSQ